MKAATCKNLAVGSTPPIKVGNRTLVRTEFTTSRLADFASRDELTRQIGHSPDRWPVVILKELVDNALDDCERAGVAPDVRIIITEGSITVADNGSGIAPDVVERILDYGFKTSSNSAYKSPTRGQQGNALQTLFAMSHALTGRPGVTVIESRGVQHRITFSVDPISREPRLEHQRAEIGVTAGTKITLFWSDFDLYGAKVDLHNAAIDFVCTNPHLTLSFTLPGGFSFTRGATNPAWTKWRPSDPTSAHWYGLQSLKDLLAAEISHARRNGSAQRTVADFIADFRGLSATGKRRHICEAVGASRQSIEDFFGRGDDDARRLLHEMKQASRPVRPRDLGEIGEAHALERIGGEPASQRYKRLEVDVDGVPYLIEAGFGHHPDTSRRGMVSGLNWSVAIGGNPFPRLTYGRSLDFVLAEQRAGADEPIGFFLHVASPRLAFLDRGKSSVDLPHQVGKAIVAAVEHVTATWAKQRKAEEREASARLRRDDVLNARTKPMTTKDAAYSLMGEAYAEASGNGALPATARQILRRGAALNPASPRAGEGERRVFHADSARRLCERTPGRMRGLGRRLRRPRPSR